MLKIMKKIRPLSLLALILFVGCNNNTIEGMLGDEVVEPQFKWYYSVASSRTALGDVDENGHRAIYWRDGDCLAINGIVSDPLSGVGEGARSATFAFYEQPTPPYSLLYPASIYKDSETITLPVRREVSLETFDAPMAALVDAEGAASLHHICAAVRLPLVKDPTNSFSAKYPLKYVKFEGNNKEQISGNFAIDYATQTLTSLVPPPADGYYNDSRYVRTYIDCTLTDEVSMLVIVVPAVEYTKGFTIKVYNIKGHYMECVKKTPVTLAPGQIYTLPTTKYSPTSTEFEAGT